MGNLTRMLASFFLAVSLVCLQAVPAFAEETEPALLKPSPALDSGETPVDSGSGSTGVLWIQVGSYEELFDALDTNSKEPRYIRATQDITIPLEEEYTTRLNAPIHLDVGPNTLYVQGLLELQSGLTITGSGGENGLVHVRTGGQAHIHDVPLKADGGYAVWQEEGAILTYTPTEECRGDVRFAEKAVAAPHSFISWQVAMPVAVVYDGQTLADVLPKTDWVNLFMNGFNTPKTDIPVVWDLARYQAQLDNSERVLITGAYPDAAAFYTPVCLVTFQNGNPIVFLSCYGTESYGVPKAKVSVELMEPELGCRFEWSQDGTVWQRADMKEAHADESGQLKYILSFPSDEPPVYPYYLSAVVDYPDGSVDYSDVIAIREAQVQCDSGGNRGGGTDLAPPTLLPPLGEGEENEDVSSSETPDPPSPGQTSPGGNTSGGESGSSGGTPPRRTDTVQGEPAKTSLSPVSAPTSTPQPAVRDTPASTAQTEQTNTSPQAAEPSDPARAALALAAPEPPPASNRAVWQVAAGTAATGGLIALIMTYSYWGGRLAALLRRLLGKQ